MKFKIPNILTIGRIIIVPIFVLTFFLPGFFGDLIPFFLFVLASFTDYLDGLLARVLIITREIIISGLREFLAKGSISMPVTGLAKVKAFIQMFSISILLLGDFGNKIINFQDYNAQTIGIILLWVSAAFTLYTGYDYLVKGIDHALSEDYKS